MRQRLLRLLRKWFNNECRVCGYRRLPAFVPYCSANCQQEEARRRARGY